MNDQVTQERNVERLVAILKVTIVALVVGGLTFGAVIFLRDRRTLAAEKGFSALYVAEQIERTVQKELKAGSTEDAFDLLAKGPADRKTSFESALTKVVNEYPGSAAALSAGLKLGRLYAAAGDSSKAETVLRGVFESSPPKEQTLYRALAGQALGSVLESQQDFEKAQQTYEKAAALADGALKPLALLGRARSLKALGRSDESKALYLKVIEEFPSSLYARQARALLNAPGG